jgi:hypothetical protein
MYSNIFTDVQIEDRRMKKRMIDVSPSGPSQRDLEQMAEREIQMAAYLATNPDPVTGLPIRQAQEFPRPLPERDRPSFNPYTEGPRSNYDLPIFEQLLYADLYRFGY